MVGVRAVMFRLVRTVSEMSYQNESTESVDFARLARIASLGSPERRVVYRKKRYTKGELVKLYYERRSLMSPEIGTELREGADDVKLNVLYEITNVESVTTDVAMYQGIRVEMLTAKAQTGTVMLWRRPVTGKGSKLGVFIDKLGSNTDKWLHKWVIFREWEAKKRLIEIATAPVEKITKATTAKGVAKAAREAK